MKYNAGKIYGRKRKRGMEKFYDRQQEMDQLRDMRSHLYRGREVKVIGVNMEEM